MGNANKGLMAVAGLAALSGAYWLGNHSHHDDHRGDIVDARVDQAPPPLTAPIRVASLEGKPVEVHPVSVPLPSSAPDAAPGAAAPARGTPVIFAPPGLAPQGVSEAGPSSNPSTTQTAPTPTTPPTTPPGTAPPISPSNQKQVKDISDLVGKDGVKVAMAALCAAQPEICIAALAADALGIHIAIGVGDTYYEVSGEDIRGGLANAGSGTGSPPDWLKDPMGQLAKSPEVRDALGGADPAAVAATVKDWLKAASSKKWSEFCGLPRPDDFESEVRNALAQSATQDFETTWKSMACRALATRYCGPDAAAKLCP